MEGMTMESLSELFSESQAQILLAIKQQGEVTAADLSDSVDLAVTTVRQHLNRLQDQGLLVHRAEPRGRGRPTHLYRLSERAERLFPSIDAAMLNRLLDFLSREGHHRAIDAFFRDFWDERTEEFQRRLDQADGTDLEVRLEILDAFLTEQGFMPEIDHTDGEVTIRECNCPLSEAVESTRLPCRLEAEFLELVVGQSLERVAYMPDGHDACTYTFASDTGEE
jgi:predicted ArsR family transcriptional regulator